MRSFAINNSNASCRLPTASPVLLGPMGGGGGFLIGFMGTLFLYGNADSVTKGNSLCAMSATVTLRLSCSQLAQAGSKVAFALRCQRIRTLLWAFDGTKGNLRLLL